MNPAETRPKIPVTVIVADDHATLRDLLVRHVLLPTHYNVVAQLKRGDDVADECERLKPQLLILDIDLPGLDGVSAARAVRERSPDTRILIFTGFADQHTLRNALRAGVCGFVEKGADIETFERAVASVAKGQTFFGDEILKILPETILNQDAIDRTELTPREREVLLMVAQGESSKEVSEKLDISLRTVDHHRSNLMAKLGARNLADLTREAFRLGLLDASIVHKRDQGRALES